LYKDRAFAYVGEPISQIDPVIFMLEAWRKYQPNIPRRVTEYILKLQVFFGIKKYL